ncbi:MAG TPA: hypothetical protein VK356_12440 [Thermomicrobiales bacterium]|nr:hypothetical protein [Thermomicrobiales bacterium]
MIDGDAQDDGAGAPKLVRTGSWVRPLAATSLALSAFAAFWMLSRYLQTPQSVTAAPDSPLFAATIVLAVIALMALAVLVFRPERGHLLSLARTSAAWSITLLVALVVAWSAIATTERQNRWHGTLVTSAEEVDSYLVDHLPTGLDPIRIPTGVLIQSMEFLSGDNVQVSGYVWQRYGPDVPPDLERGVVLVEAIKEAYDTREAYRYEQNGIETVGWYFAATLRQPFEYAEFPFDEQDLWLRMWSRDFSRAVVLVPDFDAYYATDPATLPGIEREFVYSGWNPLYSGYSFSNQSYNSSFGIGDAGEFHEFPELYFNLVLDRNFTGPFFEHFVFAIAVAFLLFGLLTLTTDDESLKSRFGLSTAGVLAAASGLLFAVILKHNQIRSGVGSRGISYIELIPIILYVVIIVVVLNAILLASPVRVKIISHRNNLIPTLLYWPVLLGLLLAITLWIFFRA